MCADFSISSIIDNGFDIVYVLDRAGVCVHVSQSVERVLGYRRDEILGKAIFDFVLPQDRALVQQGYQEAMARGKGEFGTLCLRLLTKGGQVCLLEVNRRLVFEAGQVVRSEGVARDITERQRLEDDLLLYREVITNSNDAIGILDTQGEFIAQNPAHQSLLGYNDDELLGKTPALYSGERFFRQVSRRLRVAGRFEGELLARTKDGRQLDIELSAFVVRDGAGEAVCYVGFVRDITGRKRAEARRQMMQRVREEILKATGVEELDAVMQAIGRGLDELGIPYHNHGINVLADLQDSSNQMLHLRSLSRQGRWLTAQVDSKGILGRFWKAAEPTYRRDLEASDPYGEREYLQRHAQIRSVVDVPFSHGTLAVNSTIPDAFSNEDLQLFQEVADVLSDGFRRMEHMRQLALSEQSYRTLVETPDFVVMLLNRQSEFVYISPQVEQWLGYRPEDFYADPQLGHQLVDPHHVEKVTRAFAQALEGRGEHNLEYPLRTRDGQVRWISESIFPILAPDGQVHTVQVVAHDITQEKATIEKLESANEELIKAQGQLARSEKMAMLGNLVAGIAHEINTPIGAINSAAQTSARALEHVTGSLERCQAGQDPREDRRFVKALEIMQANNGVIAMGSQRVTEIVRSLRNHARMDDAELKETDVHVLLDDTIMLLFNAIKTRIEIVKDYGQIPRIWCYPGRLNQVFLNIINNAQQAIEVRGKIRLATEHAEAWVRVSISDTGKGIPEAIREKIFQEGFTTKGLNTGTGLGLAICNQIVAEHQGHIEVESREGEGSTFTVVLPVRPVEAAC